MPFTFSHPAIVLPFIKKYKKKVSATGLVVGSIVPDFEGFIRLNSTKIYGHTFVGIFWFDLPLGILISYIFHGIIREYLINYSPAYFKRRFIYYKNFNWNYYFIKHWQVIIISMLLGIGSHLILDLVTRLKLPLPETENEHFNDALQHICSILGCVVIFYYISKMPAKPGIYINNKKVFIYWAVFFLLSSLIYILMNVAMGIDIKIYFITLENIYVVIAAILLAFFILSLAIYVYK